MELNSEAKVKYLKLINIEAATFRDLYDLYFSTKIKGSKEYIQLQDVNKKILERTGILFTSVLVQKILKKNARVLSSFGHKLEEFINIVFNENIFTQILVNKLQG